MLYYFLSLWKFFSAKPKGQGLFQMVIAAMVIEEIKRCLLPGRKVLTNLDSICLRKLRHYFAIKGLSTQSYGFLSSHVWM